MNDHSLQRRVLFLSQCGGRGLTRAFDGFQQRGLMSQSHPGTDPSRRDSGHIETAHILVAPAVPFKQQRRTPFPLP